MFQWWHEGTDGVNLVKTQRSPSYSVTPWLCVNLTWSFRLRKNWMFRWSNWTTQAATPAKIPAKIPATQATNPWVIDRVWFRKSLIPLHVCYNSSKTFNRNFALISHFWIWFLRLSCNDINIICVCFLRATQKSWLYTYQTEEEGKSRSIIRPEAIPAETMMIAVQD